MRLIATAFMIAAAFAISFDVDVKNVNRPSLSLMLLSSLGLATFTLPSRYFVQEIYWLTVMTWSLIGSGGIGIILLSTIPSYRHESINLFRKATYFIIGIFVLLEILETAAEAALSKALSIASSAGHVQAMNGLQPFFVLLFGILAYYIAPKWYAKPTYGKSFAWQILCLSAMFLGVFLLYSYA